MLVLTLYSRPGCALCDTLHAELSEALAGRRATIDVVDVDGDPALAERYGWDVPVLVAGDEEICRHRLDQQRLAAWLDGH